MRDLKGKLNVSGRIREEEEEEERKRDLKGKYLWTKNNNNETTKVITQAGAAFKVSLIVRGTRNLFYSDSGDSSSSS